MGDWCLIESDPGVFTELLQQFGVKGAQVDEVWSLDEDLDSKKPIYGIIFLFKWTSGPPCQGKMISDDRLLDVYFAKQVINNACATQALISILFNINDSSIDLGDTLNSFRSFTQSFDPVSRGVALSNSDSIRMVHNSFAKPSLIEFDEKGVPKKDEDVFHYVVYIPSNGRLFELDGLQDGPIDHGPIPAGGDWVAMVKPIINNRIENKGGLLYNLMALISDRKKIFEEKVKELTEISNSNQNSKEVMKKLDEYRALLSQEVEKREMYKVENVRRRHNYIPFVVEFFKILAEKGELAGLMEKASNKAKDRAAKKSAENSKS